MKFDVHHAGAIGGTPIGALIRTIDADTHRHAKYIAGRDLPGVNVVVLAHRPTTAKLEAAIRRLDRRPQRERTRFSRPSTPRTRS